MIPKVIKNEKEFQIFSEYISSVFHKELSEEESNNVEVISALIDNYENNISETDDDLNDDETIDYIYQLVSSVSSFEKSQDIVKRALKLSEEVGELSAEVLKLDDYKHHNNTKEEIRHNILSESVDCLIMIFDILQNQKYTKEEIIDEAEIKIEKWLNNLKNK